MNPGSPPRAFGNITNSPPPAPKLGYTQFFDYSTNEWKFIKKEK